MTFRAAFGPPANDLQRLVFELIGRDEELFQLLLDRSRQVADVLQRQFGVRTPRHGEQSVVPLGLVLALLLDLQNADHATLDDKARKVPRRGSP